MALSRGWCMPLVLDHALLAALDYLFTRSSETSTALRDRYDGIRAASALERRDLNEQGEGAQSLSQFLGAVWLLALLFSVLLSAAVERVGTGWPAQIVVDLILVLAAAPAGTMAIHRGVLDGISLGGHLQDKAPVQSNVLWTLCYGVAIVALFATFS